MTLLDIAAQVGPWLLAIAALITAAATAIHNRRADKADEKRADAETEKTYINGQSVVITNLCTEVDRLSKRVDQLEEEYALLQRKYDHVLDWAIPRGYKPPASW